MIRKAMIATAALMLLVAACGGSDSSDTTVTEAPAQTTMAPETTMDPENTEMPDDMTGDLTAMNIGMACAAVPEDGAGSFDGMAQDPAATAASNNPVLSTLVTAVSEAGLVDTLNSEGPFTIFAPYNDAFAAIPEEDLAAVLADQELLTSILTYHVAAGDSWNLAELTDTGTIETVNGGTLTIEANADTATVNGANIICGNIQTANATVHIIDQVLMP